MAKRRDEISDLVRLTKSKNPRPEHLRQLREHLDADDTLVRANEITAFAFKNVFDSYSDRALDVEVRKRELEAKRSEFGYSEENLMVRMMIDQVIMAHLRLNAYEAFHARASNEPHSMEVGLHREKILNQYQRRFLRACESLARVRKLVQQTRFT